jgi:hypothetical protein
VEEKSAALRSELIGVRARIFSTSNGLVRISLALSATVTLRYYYEVDATTRKVMREYLGYGFVRSPDLAKVAHVGWIIHFAPPWVKSQYLQVGNTILYPLPPGIKPVDQKPLQMAPEVVTGKGLVYAGVHEFESRFAWSPDSRRVGFIDTVWLTIDFGTTLGRLLKKVANVVAVGLDGTFNRTPISMASSSMSAQQVVLRWTDARTLVATFPSGDVQLRVR